VSVLGDILKFAHLKFHTKQAHLNNSNLLLGPLSIHTVYINVESLVKTPRLGQMSLPWQQGLAPQHLHGSIESAIPENPLVGANISSLS